MSLNDGFDLARGVEARGLEVLLPFLEERAHEGRYVVTSKGRLARYLQETVGDVIFNSSADTIYTVEIKVEEKHTGNLFLETWSNRNLDNKAEHGVIGSNPGWLFKQRADLLFYYFLDADILYIISLFRLQQWAFGHHDQPGQIYDFIEVPQGKYVQPNDTHGRLVKAAVLAEALGPTAFQVAYPRQIPLFPEAA